MRTYFIKTYGCQMNVHDSDKLSEVLESHGYQGIPDLGPEDLSLNRLGTCDIVLVNTCCVREAAENRALGFITSLKNLKKKNPHLKIGICGCIVNEDHIDLKKMFPHADWFIPPNSPERLEVLVNRESKVENRPRPEGLRPEGKSKIGNYAVIMHGCDNFCSYCVVPYVRGREISRPLDEVLVEIGQLIGQGAEKIMLLGQNVNSYKYGLSELLYKIQPFVIRNSSLVPREIEGLVISFMTSHPKDMSDELIQTVYELPYVAKEFHLPLQAGDDEILEKMNRKYTLEYFKDRVKKIRELMPRAGITTDIIVGFPGETEEQFQNTLNAVREIRFNAVNMAAYSIRPQTAAARLPGHLTPEIKDARLQRLIETVREVVRA
jgi:tRNA-2-methylthio-N6-dimethylallyladenosine synthase